MARRFLAIPATSAPIERVFSISGNIITKSRHRLSSETLKKSILLKSWSIKEMKELEENYQNSGIIRGRGGLSSFVNFIVFIVFIYFIILMLL